MQETKVRAGQLSDIFKNENTKQGKEFDYLDLQSDTTAEEHRTLKEISQEIGSRANEMEKKVGV